MTLRQSEKMSYCLERVGNVMSTGKVLCMKKIKVLS